MKGGYILAIQKSRKHKNGSTAHGRSSFYVVLDTEFKREIETFCFLEGITYETFLKQVFEPVRNKYKIENTLEN